MKITSKIPELSSRSALTIGNFDGLHMGHIGLVKKLVSYASAHNLVSVMMTFDPHPIELLNPGQKIPRITGLQEMYRILEPQGMEYLVQLPFTSYIAELNPEEFFNKIVVQGFAPDMIIVGQDHHFGKNREGTPEKLKELGKTHGISVVVFPQVIKAGKPVSSTRIRREIDAGRVVQARKLLGHALIYTGQVIRGATRGTHLGFPTANLELPGRCLPPSGVYASRTLARNQWWDSMSYIGKSPTFDGDVLRLETNLFADPGEMYDETIVVDIIDKIRDEIRFSSQAALINQMQIDKMKTQQILVQSRI